MNEFLAEWSLPLETQFIVWKFRVMFMLQVTDL